MSERDELFGVHTVIVAHSGDADPDRRAALLEATERELRLPPGRLRDQSGMERPEFRLVEGVSSEVAERLAATAARLGFDPRVRDRMGIKMSSERTSLSVMAALGVPVLGAGVGMLLSLAATALGVWLQSAVLITVVSPLAFTLPLLLSVGVMFWLIWRWYRSLEMPLVVARAAMELPPLAETNAVEQGSLVGVGAARKALERLHKALESAEVPDAPKADILRTHEALVLRVSALEAGLRDGPPESTPAVQTLQARLDALQARADPDPVEVERLMSTLGAEAAARDLASGRRAAAVAELLQIRRVVLSAVDDLQRPASDSDLAARLAAETELLFTASHEVAGVAGVAGPVDGPGAAEADSRAALAALATQAQRSRGIREN